MAGFTPENSPFRPPTGMEQESYVVPKREGRSHWAVRVFVLFIGSMVVGMGLAISLQGFFLSLVGLGMILLGITFIRAGILDRPPNLELLRPTPRRR